MVTDRSVAVSPRGKNGAASAGAPRAVAIPQAANSTQAARHAVGPGARVRHVALIVESAVAPRRMMLTGVARYIQEHEPWAVYLKPFGVEKSLEHWLGNWKGDGIIAAVHDPPNEAIERSGIPVVDVVGAFRRKRVPLVHTNDKSVGRVGAEHLLERGFRHLAFCEYEGLFWSSGRREGFIAAAQGHG